MAIIREGILLHTDLLVYFCVSIELSNVCMYIYVWVRKLERVCVREGRRGKKKKVFSAISLSRSKRGLIKTTYMSLLHKVGELSGLFVL